MPFGVTDLKEEEDEEQGGIENALPDRFDYGDKDLEITEDKTVYDSFFSETKDFTYRSDRLLIAEYVDRDKYFYLDATEAFRMILFASTRSGKSFNVQRIMGIAYQSGYDLAVLPDAKNEFRTMDREIQEKFRRREEGRPDNTAHLHPEEEPKALRVQSYRPTFFEKVDNGSLPIDNKYCSVDITDLTKADFKTLVNYDGMTATQQDAFESLYYEIEEGNIEGLGEMLDFITASDISSGTKRVLRQKFENLDHANFFNSQYIVNPVDVIKKGKIPILNMQKFDSFSREGSGMPQSMISIWLRKIINARRDNDIDETIIVTDETARWIPKNGDPSCKQEFIESVDLDTGEGINYIFATQRPGSVPDDLISQCRYVLIPWNLDTEDMKDIIKKAGIARNVQTAYNTASRIKNNMGQYEWLIIDQQKTTYDKIKFLAPPCFHKETDQ